MTARGPKRAPRRSPRSPVRAPPPCHEVAEAEPRKQLVRGIFLRPLLATIRWACPGPAGGPFPISAGILRERVAF